MRKIFESELNGLDNYSAEKVYVYALENNDEFWELADMDHEERCRYFDVYEEHGVAPGSKFHRYDFDLYENYIIMVETIAYNV